MTTMVHYFRTQPLSVDGQSVRLRLSGTTRQLFLFLLVNSCREWRRDFLAEQFWPTAIQRRQKSCLNSAVWRIKNQLESIPGIHLRARGHQLRLLLDPAVSSDLEELALLLSRQQEDIPEPSAARWLARVFHDGNASWLDDMEGDWVQVARERVSNLSLRGLTQLMHWYSQEGRYDEALEIGRRLTSNDPTRETLQCSVLWLYVLNGQRGQALRHYEKFRRWLKGELGIEPMPETQALHDYIRRGLNAHNAPSLKLPDSSGGHEGQRENPLPLQRMMAVVEDSRLAFLEDLKRLAD